MAQNPKRSKEILRILEKSLEISLTIFKRVAQSAMTLNLEIDDETGEMLDALAKEQDRSRSAQARRMLIRAIREAANEPQPEEATA